MMHEPTNETGSEQMTVYYEWDVEEVDEHEDIQDHNHTTSYAKAKELEAIPNEPGMTSRIVLIRDDDNMRTGCRAWAYMEDGKLPAYFEDANGIEVSKVPKRFHEEVEDASIDWDSTPVVVPRNY